jgi:hypothetical protein
MMLHALRTVSSYALIHPWQRCYKDEITYGMWVLRKVLDESRLEISATYRMVQVFCQHGHLRYGPWYKLLVQNLLCVMKNETLFSYNLIIYCNALRIWRGNSTHFRRPMWHLYVNRPTENMNKDCWTIYIGSFMFLLLWVLICILGILQCNPFFFHWMYLFAVHRKLFVSATCMCLWVFRKAFPECPIWSVPFRWLRGEWQQLLYLLAVTLEILNITIVAGLCVHWNAQTCNSKKIFVESQHCSWENMKQIGKDLFHFICNITLIILCSLANCNVSNDIFSYPRLDTG